LLQDLPGDKVDAALLGGDYPGIEMSGLPKGMRLEASVRVFVAYKANLLATSVEPKALGRGHRITITYEIECSENVARGIWLGASFRDEKTGKFFHNISEDKAVSLKEGTHTYERVLTIPRDAPPGRHMVATNIWRGVAGDSTKSKRIAGGPPVAVEVLK
jgi:hypothetical protein